MSVPPIEPAASRLPFAPAAERRLTVLGVEVSLVLVPDRRARGGRAVAGRPALQRCPASRILAEEALWRADALVLTPNRYPFAAGQRLLWMAGPTREPDRAFWLAALAWAERAGGSVLLNTVGAAATIARAHAHLVPERRAFLGSLPTRQCTLDLIDVPPGGELIAVDAPFCALGVRGPVAARATALVLLAEARLTAACNVVAEGDTAWVVPRTVETPAPWFPQALGAAELWGRWCYVDEAPFAAATGADLERALVEAGAMPLG